MSPATADWLVSGMFVVVFAGLLFCAWVILRSDRRVWAYYEKAVRARREADEAWKMVVASNDATLRRVQELKKRCEEGEGWKQGPKAEG